MLDGTLLDLSNILTIEKGNESPRVFQYLLYVALIPSYSYYNN